MAAERHLSDGQMVRALDDDGSVAEARAWDAHLSRCGRCADEMARLRSESRRVSDWLDRAAFEAAAPGTDPAAPLDDPRPALRIGPARRPARRPLSSPWLRAAAILALVAAPVAAIPAARSRVAAWVLGPAEPATGETAMAVDAAPVVRFVPSPGPFTIRFDTGASGTLSLARAKGDEAELTGVDSRADAMVSASLVRLRDGTGRYRLRLPAAVTAVEVRVGDRTVSVDAGAIDGGTVVDLSAD